MNKYGNRCLSGDRLNEKTLGRAQYAGSHPALPTNFLTCAAWMDTQSPDHGISNAKCRVDCPGYSTQAVERSELIAGIKPGHRSFLHAGIAPSAPLKSAGQAHGNATSRRPVKPRLLAPFHREHPTTGAGRGCE